MTLTKLPRALYFPLREWSWSLTVTGEQWYRFSGPTPSKFNLSILGSVQKSCCGNWGTTFWEIFHHIVIPFPTLCRNPPTLPPCWDPDLEPHPFFCIEFNLTKKAESRRWKRRLSQQNYPLPWRKGQLGAGSFLSPGAHTEGQNKAMKSCHCSL